MSLAKRLRLLVGGILLAPALVLGGCGGDVQEEQQDVKEAQKDVEEEQQDVKEAQQKVKEEQKDVKEAQKDQGAKPDDKQDASKPGGGKADGGGPGGDKPGKEPDIKP